VHAEVVLKAGFSLTEDELIAHCRDYLAGYKLPRSVALVDALPLTAVGKVDKVAIRDKHDG
jgi:acyl-CoA synthetase (AMP-forming)/AMP-acid ligase II